MSKEQDDKRYDHFQRSKSFSDEMKMMEESRKKRMQERKAAGGAGIDRNSLGSGSRTGRSGLGTAGRHSAGRSGAPGRSEETSRSSATGRRGASATGRSSVTGGSGVGAAGRSSATGRSGASVAGRSSITGRSGAGATARNSATGRSGAGATARSSARGRNTATSRSGAGASGSNSTVTSRRYNAQLARKRKEDAKKRRRNTIFTFVGMLLLVLVFVYGGMKIINGLTNKNSFLSQHTISDMKDQNKKTDQTGDKDQKDTDQKSTEKADEKTTESTEKKSSILDILKKDGSEDDKETAKKKTMDEAQLLATQYDYDAAIAKVQTIEGYDTDEECTAAIKGWEDIKATLVGYTAKDVTHIFYHTLVEDPELAFECDPGIAEGFKLWMTTIVEFDRITNSMYNDGYVLCSLYDFFEESYDEDGTPHFKEKTVYLPPGKTPFILSIDDLSYYHTYTGHGMATKLVLDDNGKITCEYVERDGTTVTGSYDCVPRMNDFMEEHPDGCYRGARGTIALTGYNGIFGYRTDESYVTQENLDQDKIDWLKENPDFDHDKEVAEAKKIADEMKAEGWDFASHTWGHIRVGKAALEKIKIDTEKWLKNVKPIIGDTECIIFAHGQDLSSSDSYDTDNNEKYKYLASKGFHIFLNVDSYAKTMSVHDLYVHGGRRNLDGYRLWTDGHGKADWTSDLIDAGAMLDERRTSMPDAND